MISNDNVVKITATLLFFIEGILCIVAAIINKSMKIQNIYIFILIWILLFCVLFSIGASSEKQIRAFVFISVFSITALAVYASYLLDNPYLYVILASTLWICNITGLRRYVFTALFYTDLIICTAMRIVFKKFTLGEYAVIVIGIIFSYWVSYYFSYKAEKMVQMLADQENSYDDMIELMEARFIEEKGANTAKSSFLANMSHEIRTPINAILGLNTMITRESTENNILEYSDEINNAGNTLIALINDILDISKVESGKMEIIPVEYDFSSLLNDVVNMISFKVESKRLELHVNVDETLPCRMLGDDVRIRQILINLLNNAVKYTEIGSVTLSVTGERDGDYIRLKYEISDTGIGIRDEDMDKLFAKFERLDVERNRNIEGTGLGMAITARLLSLMNTELNVTSKYGKGTTFSFYLSQKIINNKPVGNINKRYNKSAKNDDSEVRYIAPDARVLVVDDNKTNRMVFRNLLKRIKIQVEEADNGQNALNIANKNEFDIIFLDHMMPGMDGIETLRRMRENTVCPNYGVPVIALTANAIAGSREYYLSEGFDDYLSKPIDAKKLEKMIFDRLPDNKKELFS